MAIYNGTQKINMSGIDKVYVGSQLVYQKQLPPSWHTIFEGDKTWTSANNNVNRRDWTDPIIETASEYKFRISFTSSAEAQAGGQGSSVYSATHGPGVTLYNSSKSSSTSGSATKTDFEFNAITSGTKNPMISIDATRKEYGGTNHSTGLNLYFDATTKQFYIKSYFDTEDLYGASTFTKLKITKVEQYY